MENFGLNNNKPLGNRVLKPLGNRGFFSRKPTEPFSTEELANIDLLQNEVTVSTTNENVEEIEIPDEFRRNHDDDTPAVGKKDETTKTREPDKKDSAAKTPKAAKRKT